MSTGTAIPAEYTAEQLTKAWDIVAELFQAATGGDMLKCCTDQTFADYFLSDRTDNDKRVDYLIRNMDILVNATRERMLIRYPGQEAAVDEMIRVRRQMAARLELLTSVSKGLRRDVIEFHNVVGPLEAADKGDAVPRKTRRQQTPTAAAVVPKHRRFNSNSKRK